MSLLEEALLELNPNCEFSLRGNTITRYKNGDSTTPPNQAIIDAKIEELASLVPMKFLRMKRNELLQQTDGYVLQDYKTDPIEKNKYLNYRQYLRDLPDNVTPEIDQYNNLLTTIQTVDNMNGSNPFVTVITDDHTLAPCCSKLMVDTSSKSITVTLPVSACEGLETKIKDTNDCSIYPITIIGTIDNETNLTMNQKNQCITIGYVNNKWFTF